MSRDDRAVRRARRHLAIEEVVVASAVGVEVDGRRRRVVLMTDRRVMVVGLRGGPPVDLPLAECHAEYDPTGGLLTVATAGSEEAIRDVEATEARRLADLLADHRPLPPTATVGRVAHVRIVPDDD